MGAGEITMQFSTEKGFGSWLIRYLSDGDYSHVDIVLQNGRLGARLKGGVTVRPPDYATFTVTKRMTVQVPNYNAAMAYAYAQVGKPYAIMAIVDFFLHRRKPLEKNPKAWFCDQLAYAICMAGGVELLATDNPDNLTPYELSLSPLLKEVE